MKLHHKECGSGKPLIILHGLFGSLDNWGTIAKCLAEYFKVYVIDQRNHGNSPHAYEVSYELMAEDLEEFMAEHDLDSASIMGHSMGGKTAMQFAFTYSQKVDKLVVVDISPRDGGVGHTEVRDALRALRAIDLENIRTRRQASEQMKPHIKDIAIRQFLLKGLTRDEDGKFKWRVNLDAISSNFDRIVGGVNGRPFDKPCLFIRGGNSDHIDDEDWGEIRECFPQAELVTIPGAGHWVHVDAPDVFKKALLDYFHSE